MSIKQSVEIQQLKAQVETLTQYVKSLKSDIININDQLNSLDSPKRGRKVGQKFQEKATQ